MNMVQQGMCRKLLMPMGKNERLNLMVFLCLKSLFEISNKGAHIETYEEVPRKSSGESISNYWVNQFCIKNTPDFIIHNLIM